MAERANSSIMFVPPKLRTFIGKALRHWRKQGYVPCTTVSTSAHTIPANRALTSEERALIEWLIAHWTPEAKEYAEQVESLRVLPHCSCGCPTIDLAVGSAQTRTTGPSDILADLFRVTPEGIEVGVILHARQGKISELEVYSMVEQTSCSLPRIETLK
jgi:hypothetical protein